MADSSISSIRYKDISDDKVDIAVTKSKCPVTLIRNRELTSSSRKTVSFSSALTMKRWASRCASATTILTRGNCARQGQLLEEAEQFEHDYDNDNYADYVEDVSVHAVLISEWVGGGQHLMQTSSLDGTESLWSHGRVTQYHHHARFYSRWHKCCDSRL
jgi:hypothetical protein